MDRMRKCSENPNVIFQIMTPNLLDTFIDSNKALDEIQKCLNDFLETKCAAFPRFYFVSRVATFQCFQTLSNATATSLLPLSFNCLGL